MLEAEEVNLRQSLEVNTNKDEMVRNVEDLKRQLLDEKMDLEKTKNSLKNTNENIERILKKQGGKLVIL